MLKKNTGKKIFLVLLMIYLFIPILATILFSVTDKWDTTILPQSYTLKYYSIIFSDDNFITSLLQTINISVITSIVSVIILVPCIYVTSLYYKKLEKFFEILAVIPFILPGVILAIGLIQMYSKDPINITGTIWILFGAYFVLCLPFMYRSIKNSFIGIDALRLTEAAMILGCNEFQAFLKVIIPNVIRGIISAVLLSISILFGEFVLANLLVGNNYRTIQIYLFNALNSNGHTASAIVSVYLIVIFMISYIAILLTGKKQRKMED
ncbi:ABC transporter permease [Clostridium sp. DJ247]|uniref:ABC transporter permease n=1 Tax=Clostridium sp. DJ247 TaxID=2726188 RepID=UPI001625EB16|nr:ABC transporter permease [Clostridium sp. DJ247]MBC2579441.1 ABC transporter permease [Clostridium sp. DJ247]